jgi:hypothetical protein
LNALPANRSNPLGFGNVCSASITFSGQRQLKLPLLINRRRACGKCGSQQASKQLVRNPHQNNAAEGLRLLLRISTAVALSTSFPFLSFLSFLLLFSFFSFPLRVLKK